MGSTCSRIGFRADVYGGPHVYMAGGSHMEGWVPFVLKYMGVICEIMGFRVIYIVGILYVNCRWAPHMYIP